MWPFKKKRALCAPSLEPSAEGTGREVDADFGAFAPLFEDALVGYLPLLHLCGSEATHAISLVMKCCASVSNPHQGICRMLRQPAWRPHLVSAVAIATLPYDPETNHALWFAIDKGSWVTPQLAVAAFLRDPAFVDHAQGRLRSGCPVDTDHVAPSAKMAASLVRLISLRLQQPDWVSAQAAAKVTSLLNKDVDSSGEIAERWLMALKKHLGAL